MFFNPHLRPHTSQTKIAGHFHFRRRELSLANHVDAMNDDKSCAASLFPFVDEDVWFPHVELPQFLQTHCPNRIQTIEKLNFSVRKKSREKSVQINGVVACARLSQTMQVSFVSSKWDHQRVGDTILLGSRECHAQSHGRRIFRPGERKSRRKIVNLCGTRLSALVSRKQQWHHRRFWTDKRICLLPFAI